MVLVTGEEVLSYSLGILGAAGVWPVVYCSEMRSSSAPLEYIIHAYPYRRLHGEMVFDLARIDYNSPAKYKEFRMIADSKCNADGTKSSKHLYNPKGGNCTVLYTSVDRVQTQLLYCTVYFAEQLLAGTTIQARHTLPLPVVRFHCRVR